jgi:transposase-like protein
VFGTGFVSAECHNLAMYNSDVRRHAVALMARGQLLRSISMATGINRATLRDWREHPEKA